MKALVVEGVGKRFGALRVLDDVSFDVAPGEALGVVGPNGAGKTTLLDIVAGAQRRDRGRVLLGGDDVTALPPARRCRLGLARTFQVPRPLGDLTVFETALLASVRAGGRRGREAQTCAVRALELAGLTAEGDLRSAGLGLLSRKRLELARALAGTPRVLLLDEIAGGLTDAETGALLTTINGLVASGVAVVWVEHVLRALTRVADRLICLAGGRVLASGTPPVVLADPAVRAAYLGRGAP